MSEGLFLGEGKGEVEPSVGLDEATSRAISRASIRAFVNYHI